MPVASPFKLAKLTITPYKDVGRKKTIGPVFEAQYNPESLSLEHQSVYPAKQGIATSAAQARYSHSLSKDLDITLVFDGTHVGRFGLAQAKGLPSVRDRIQAFLDACYAIKGTTHEPAFLRLSWGKGVLGSSFDCRLKSAEVEYTGFERDGSPLHAQVKAKFVEDLEAGKRAALEQKSSPDLTHRRTVLAGDTLPLLCLEIYGSEHHYLRVAEVNGLDGFRTLAPGQELIFPPFAGHGRDGS